MTSGPGNEQENPYVPPKSTSWESQQNDCKQPDFALTTRILVWVLLVPVLVANGIYWGYVLIFSLLVPGGVDGLGALVTVFLVVPSAGLIYGVVAGLVFYPKTPRKNILLHPVIQVIFQPCWFFFLTTIGCIASIPIVNLFSRS